MGYEIGEATGYGGRVLLLRCRECGTEFETDASTGNDCPDCGTVDWEIASAEPGTPWREGEQKPRSATVAGQGGGEA